MENVECEKCGSKNVYTTLEEVVCRKCGHRKQIKTKNKKE